jgi:hypothetical protein
VQFTGHIAIPSRCGISRSRGYPANLTAGHSEPRPTAVRTPGRCSSPISGTASGTASRTYRQLIYQACEGFPSRFSSVRCVVRHAIAVSDMSSTRGFAVCNMPLLAMNVRGSQAETYRSAMDTGDNASNELPALIAIS